MRVNLRIGVLLYTTHARTRDVVLHREMRDDDLLQARAPLRAKPRALAVIFATAAYLFVHPLL